MTSTVFVVNLPESADLLGVYTSMELAMQGINTSCGTPVLEPGPTVLEQESPGLTEVWYIGTLFQIFETELAS